MTRSGSSAARNRKPATTRHPPTPRSVRHPEPAAVRAPGRLRVRAFPPAPGRGEPPASEPPGTTRPGRGLSDPPHDDARHVDGHSPQPPGWSQLPCTPVQPACSPGPFKSVINRYLLWRSPPHFLGRLPGGRHALRCLAGANPRKIRPPKSLSAVGSQTTEPLPCRGQRISQSRRGGGPALYDRSCRLAGIWRAACLPDAEAGSVIWRASLFAIGGGRVTVTECN
jgi:hypothetical protein